MFYFFRILRSIYRLTVSELAINNLTRTLGLTYVLTGNRRKENNAILIVHVASPFVDLAIRNCRLNITVDTPTLRDYSANWLNGRW